MIEFNIAVGAEDQALGESTAVGTDLLYAAITKSGGTLVHGLNGTIDWQVTRRLASGSVPATIVALACLSWLGKSSGHGANSLITSLLGFALLLSAIFLLFRDLLLDLIARHTDGLSDGQQTRLLTILLGAFLGILVSISSVGAGAIGMTVLLALYPRLPTVRLVGSDIAHSVPLTFVAGLGYWLMGPRPSKSTSPTRATATGLVRSDRDVIT